ncbi:MAG: hypothetical protein ACE5JZ_03545 [Kiloniellales bacterium]
MADNVIQMSPPRAVRPAPEPLGLYVRAGRNDHIELLNLLAAGDAECFGVVFDAVHVNRHKELREQIVERRLDAILDPKTQPAATVGGYTEALGALPWGVGRPHRIDDFRGVSGRQRAEALGEFVLEQGFTQVLAPSHLLQNAADPWLARDIEAAGWLRDHLDRNGGRRIPLIYSLAIPYSVLRDRSERRSLANALRDVPAAAIWLKIDSFGSSSTPTAARSYIKACADFHTPEVPIVGDQVGGLIGLGLLAFGAVGGITHGVTLQERFDASYWRRPRARGKARSMPRRVYVRELDLMLKPSEAKLLLGSSSRARALFGCRDGHCCPRGARDMFENPVRHFLYQRIQEVARLGQVPESLRVQRFLEQYMRPATDRALAAANINWPDDAMAKKTRAHRKRLDHLRVALGKHAEANPPRSFASVPLRRAARESLG